MPLTINLAPLLVQVSNTTTTPKCHLTSLRQGELPIQRIAVLKHILRSMHRMMQSSGTAEGLRGLIDMTLLKSLKKVIEYRGLFGPNVLPIGVQRTVSYQSFSSLLVILAINIMSTFVHNEPTSLAIIQEAGLPETFYKAIEIGIEPAIEVWNYTHNPYDDVLDLIPP
jgi:E3 ubiquitin-protein ligase HUWE1